MTNKLDPKGLEAGARAAYEARIGDGSNYYAWDDPCFHAEYPDVIDGIREEAEAAITAYLTTTVPADVAALVERLRAMQVGTLTLTNINLVKEAASFIEALAPRPPNETLERAAKKLEEMKRLLMLQTVVLDVARECDIYDIAAAAIRSMKEPE